MACHIVNRDQYHGRFRVSRHDASDKQVLRGDTISNRSLAGLSMGLGHNARLDANCRSIKIFCLERSAIIIADPLQCRFQINSFPFRLMRLESRHIDKSIRVSQIYCEETLYLVKSSHSKLLCTRLFCQMVVSYVAVRHF